VSFVRLSKSQRRGAVGFTSRRSRAYTFNVNSIRRAIFFLAFLSCLAGAGAAPAQEPPGKPAEKAPEQASPEKEKAHAKPELPFQIQLLETHIRFEANGDSRKEVHTIVKIINILGARQFARISFDYNRAFQQVEIPLVRVSHANGGTSEVLPSAVTDAPNPAVEQFPAYHDVRVKSVRILGLQEGDTVEYRVITTTTKHPMAPDFWLEHTFDKSGVVAHELFELDLPVPRLRIRINPETPALASENSGEGESARVLYRWDMNSSAPKNAQPQDSSKPDVVLTTFSSWARLSKALNRTNPRAFSTELWALVMQAAGLSREPVPPRTVYTVVSQKIATVDLSVDLSGDVRRTPESVVMSRYGTPLEKAYLLPSAMAQSKRFTLDFPVMYGRGVSLKGELPRPTLLVGVLACIREGGRRVFLPVDVPEAPFGMIPADVRGRQALVIADLPDDSKNVFVEIPLEIPFPGRQSVTVDAAITSTGDLKARVKYSLRGDNELQLRVAFHQAPKEKWKDVASLLALSDGFRGQVTNVVASDPMATRDPFTVEYELTQPKFVDWSKKPVRIPALLPQIGLPDPPPPAEAGKPAPKIELGTPLDVQTTMTLHLPEGTIAQTPAGTAVLRDYATFTSKYGSPQNTVTASRHANFLKREIPGDRAADYQAFLHAVQNDQTQSIVLVPKPKTD